MMRPIFKMIVAVALGIELLSSCYFYPASPYRISNSKSEKERLIFKSPNGLSVIFYNFDVSLDKKKPRIGILCVLVNNSKDSIYFNRGSFEIHSTKVKYLSFAPKKVGNKIS